VADYADDCIILHVNQGNGTFGRYHGKAGARAYFKWLFTTLRGPDGKFTDDFSFTIAKPPNQTAAAPIITRNTAFETWQAKTTNTDYKWGAGTFVMDPVTTQFKEQYVFVHATPIDTSNLVFSLEPSQSASVSSSLTSMEDTLLKEEAWP